MEDEGVEGEKEKRWEEEEGGEEEKEERRKGRRVGEREEEGEEGEEEEVRKGKVSSNLQNHSNESCPYPLRLTAPLPTEGPIWSKHSLPWPPAGLLHRIHPAADSTWPQDLGAADCQTPEVRIPSVRGTIPRAGTFPPTKDQGMPWTGALWEVGRSSLSMGTLYTQL